MGFNRSFNQLDIKSLDGFSMENFSPCIRHALIPQGFEFHHVLTFNRSCLFPSQTFTILTLITIIHQADKNNHRMALIKDIPRKMACFRGKDATNCACSDE